MKKRGRGQPPPEDVPAESLFEWTEQRSEAVTLLASGLLIKEVARAVGVNEKTIDRWKRDTEFAAEMDRLSHMVDIASRAERLRIGMRIVRRQLKKKNPSKRDLLEWLKYMQSETDGVKLDLTALRQAIAPVAGGGQDGADPPAKADG